jgi:hypothetical protein
MTGIHNDYIGLLRKPTHSTIVKKRGWDLESLSDSFSYYCGTKAELV